MWGFWTGMVMGLFVGAVAGFFAAGLLMASKLADEASMIGYSRKKTERGGDDDRRTTV